MKVWISNLKRWFKSMGTGCKDKYSLWRFSNKKDKEFCISN